MRSGHATPWTGRKVLIGMLAFFGLIIAVNATMTIFALNSHPGMVSDNAYVEGVRFNSALERAEAQDRLGYVYALRFEAAGPGLVLSVTYPNDGPVAGLRGEARVHRPGEPVETFPLIARADGTYAVAADLSRKGRWLVEIAAVDPAGNEILLPRELWRD